MADVRDLLIRMSLDTATFKRNIADAKGELRTLKAEFKATEAGDEVGAAGAALLKNLQDQKTAAQALVQEYQKGVNEIHAKLDATPKGSQAAAQLQTDAAKLETAFANAKTSLANIQEQINNFKMERFIEKAQEVADIFMSLRLGLGDMLDFFGDAADSADQVHVEREAARIAGTKSIKDATEQDLAELDQQVKQLIANDLPMLYDEIYGVIQVAGQNGVGIANMLDFSTVMSKLSVATDMTASTGTEMMAQFINLTEKSYDNIDRVGSALVALGNNSATSESKIMEMAHRSASGLSQVGMRAEDILGISAAIASLGIEAQAGGSSVSKLGITMDKAANVGAQKMEELLDAWGGQKGGTRFQSIYELYAELDRLGSSNGWRKMERLLGMTAADTKALMNSALAAERFSQAMGVTVKQFSQGWNQDAASSMLQLFTALGSMGEDSEAGESMLWVMDQLGIKEIRQSNMVRALSNNWELYAAALALARDAYQENAAMDEEASRAFSTNESRRTLNQNKQQNMLEAMGETVTAMRKPFEDFFGDLQNWYASWPDWAQAAVGGAAEVMGKAGDVLERAGKLAFSVGSISDAVQKLSQTGLGAKLLSAGKTAGMVGLGVAGVAAAGYGLYELNEYLKDLNDRTDDISETLAGLEIKIDPVSKEATLAAIQEVQDAAHGLSGGDMERYASTSRVVQMGYGTAGMYGEALAYEKYQTEQAVKAIYADYGGQIRAAENELLSADSADAREAIQLRIRTLTDEMGQAVAAEGSRYGQVLNRVLGGAVEMAGGTETLEKISRQYEAMNAIMQAYGEFENPQSSSYMRPADIKKAMKAYADVLLPTDVKSADRLGAYGAEEVRNTVGRIVQGLYGALATETAQVAGNGDLMNILLGAFSADAFSGADQSQFSGAVLGLLQAMDIKSIADQNTTQWTDIGKNSMLGLGQGITDNQSGPADAARQAAQDLTAAAAAVLGVHSPSTVFFEIGENIDLGLANGIYARADEALAAASWLASSIENTMRSALDIHSPSGVARAMGGYFSEGLAEGLSSGVSRITGAADRLAASLGSQRVPQTVRIPLILDGKTMAEAVAPLIDDALGEANWNQ